MNESTEVLLRVGVSLAAVLGLIWLAARGWKRTAGGRAASASELAVIGRQSLGQRSSVALVKVGPDRVLVLGVSEQRVQLLAETTSAEVLPPVVVPQQRQAITVSDLPAVAGLPDGAGDPPVRQASGSALDPATWRQAVDAVRDRTSRR